MAIFQNARKTRIFAAQQRNQKIINALIIAGLFLAVLAVSYVAYSKNNLLTWVLAGTLGLWGGLLLVRLARFEYGIMAIMLTASLINFFTLPTGRESQVVISLVVTLALLGVWVLQLLLSRGQEHIKPSPVNLPIYLFIIVSLVSYVWSLLMRDPLLLIWDSFPLVQLAALAVNIALPLLGLMVANKVREERFLHYFAWIMIGLGTFVLVSTLLNLGLDRIFRNGMRGLFSTWVVSMALAMAIFNEQLSMKVRAFLMALVLGWSYYAVVREGHWLSGWFPFMVAGAVITYTRSKKLFVLALIGMSIIGAAKFESLYYRIYVSNVEEGSAERAELWIPNIELAMQHPLFGTGPAGYAIYYMTYHPQNARSTHNNYFDILAQTGFIGFAVFMWLFYTFFSIGNRLRKATWGRRDFREAFAHGTFGGCIAALAAMMLGDWVLPFAYNQTIMGFDNASYTWIFLGGMVALYHIMGMGEKKLD